jgi:hypothetical protein
MTSQSMRTVRLKLGFRVHSLIKKKKSKHTRIKTGKRHETTENRVRSSQV